MKAADALVRAFAERHPGEAARTLEGLDVAEAAATLGKLPESIAGGVAARLAPQSAASILSRMEQELMKQFFGSLPLQHAALVLQHLEEANREAALTGMPEAAARQVRDLLRYPPDTAGAIMDPQVTAIPIDVTCQEAIAAIRKAPRETIYYLYVTDRDRKLVGVINLRALLLGSPREPVERLLNREVIAVPATMDREDVARRMREKRLLALPVTDAEGRLIGAVRHDQALEAAQEEAFEDMQKMAGAGGDETAMSPVSTLVKRRLPWLYVNLVTAFIAAAVVGLFEQTIAKITALAVLLPIVAGQGGNTGAQTLAVVMRGLALREVLPGRGRRLIVKELLGGLINGFAVAVVTGLGVVAWDGRWTLGLVITLAMVVNMAAAAISGAVIPLALRAAGRDPAQSSSIFLTTVTDVVGFASFLGFAVLFEPVLTGRR